MAAHTPIPGAPGAEDDGMMSKVQAYLPDLSDYYLDPIDPTKEITLSDRVSLVWRSARPWGEFFDFSNFNLPPFDQWAKRLSENTVTFFYNYFLLTLAHLLIFTIGHLGAVIALVVFLALMYWLFIVNDDDIPVSDSFVISHNVKIGIAVAAGLFALLVGRVLTLVFSVAVFLAIVVGIHASIREISSAQSETLPVAAI